MQKKVVILSSGHPPKDERIFSKIGFSLSTHGYSVVICTSTEELQVCNDSILFDCFNGEKLTKREKINKFFSILSLHSPDIIISCEPIPILAGHRYKKKIHPRCFIFSDITEWYPENVAFKFNGLKKWSTYLFMYLFNIYATNLADALIIGEELKKSRYDFIAPFKKKEIISYFPRLDLFPFNQDEKENEGLNLGFTGTLNKSRGFFQFLNCATLLKQNHSELNLKLTIVGKFLFEIEKQFFEKWKSENTNISVDFSNWLPYEKLYDKLSQVDLFIDLRELNFVYHHSLPIKIFEYMAFGKPVIYSNSKSLQLFFNQFQFGKLVDPSNTLEIITAIEFYLNNRCEIRRNGSIGRQLIETKYKWNYCEAKLLRFIEKVDHKISSN